MEGFGGRLLDPTSVGSGLRGKARVYDEFIVESLVKMDGKELVFDG